MLGRGTSFERHSRRQALQRRCRRLKEIEDLPRILRTKGSADERNYRPDRRLALTTGESRFVWAGKPNALAATDPPNRRATHLHERGSLSGGAHAGRSQAFVTALLPLAKHDCCRCDRDVVIFGHVRSPSLQFSTRSPKQHQMPCLRLAASDRHSKWPRKRTPSISTCSQSRAWTFDPGGPLHVSGEEFVDVFAGLRQWRQPLSEEYVCPATPLPFEREHIAEAAIQSMRRGVVHGYQFLTKKADKSSPPPSFGRRERTGTGAIRVSTSKSRSSK